MSSSDSQKQAPIFLHTDAGDRIGLTWDKLDELKEIDHVRDASAGAICSFVGTTRDTFQGIINDLLHMTR
jgi:molybdopterin synthase catalytic subunit